MSSPEIKRRSTGAAMDVIFYNTPPISSLFIGAAEQPIMCNLRRRFNKRDKSLMCSSINWVITTDSFSSLLYKDKLVCLDWLWHNVSLGGQSLESYHALCLIAFPFYVTSDMPQVMVYYSEFCDQVRKLGVPMMDLTSYGYYFKRYYNSSPFGNGLKIMQNMLSIMRKDIGSYNFVVGIFMHMLVTKHEEIKHHQENNLGNGAPHAYTHVIAALFSTPDLRANIHKRFYDSKGEVKYTKSLSTKTISADSCTAAFLSIPEKLRVIMKCFAQNEPINNKSVTLPSTKGIIVVRASVDDFSNTIEPKHDYHNVFVAQIDAYPTADGDCEVFKKQLLPLNNMFPYTSMADKAKMTLNIASFVYNYIMPRRSNPYPDKLTTIARINTINSVLRRISIGTNQVLTLTMCITAIGHLEKHIVMREVLKRGFLIYNGEEQHALLKQFSTAVKRTSCLPSGVRVTPIQLSALSYFDLAFGRSNNTSDWEQEVKDRCTGEKHLRLPAKNNHSREAYWQDIKVEDIPERAADPDFYIKMEEFLTEYITTALSGEKVEESYADYCLRRHEWCASGSSGGAQVCVPPDSSLRYNPMKSKLPPNNVKVGKRGFMETITCAELVSTLHLNKPVEFATGSEKFENGKSRAIYAVEPFHYCISSYGSQVLEDNLLKVEGIEKALTGTKLWAAQIKRCNITADSKQHGSMFDFSNFNIQHSNDSQAMIFNVLAKVGEDMEYHPDWVRANRWVAAAKHNAAFTTPMDKKLKDKQRATASANKENAAPCNASMPSTPTEGHKVKQGMFSGTRSTDLINTILNKTYFAIAMWLLATYYGLLPYEGYFVHQGDDVWFSNQKLHYAAALFSMMCEMGLVFNPSKQMFGCGRGEYLRVLYSGGEALGYANRAVINYILRPVQGVTEINAPGWAQELNNSYMGLQRRGICLEMLNTLWDCDVLHWSKVKAHHTDDCPFRIPYACLVTSSVFGDMGVSRPGTMVRCGYPIPKIPAMRSREISGTHGLPCNMTNDWMQHVSTKMPGNDRILAASNLKAALFNTNYADVLREFGYGLDIKAYKKDWIAWAAEHSAVWGDMQAEFHNDVPIQQMRLGPTLDLDAVAEFMLGNKHTPTWVDTPYLYMILQNLNSDKNTPYYSITKLVAILRRLATQSVFKEMTMAARALAKDHLEALLWLIDVIRENVAADENPIGVLTTICLNNRRDLLDLLTSMTQLAFQTFEGYCHPAKFYECSNVARQAFVMLECSKDLSIADRSEYITRLLGNYFSCLQVWNDPNIITPSIKF